MLDKKIIGKIELENFKGYVSPDNKESVIFDFDHADLILVTGKNGVGKTSLLEALDLTLNQVGISEKYLSQGEKSGFVKISPIHSDPGFPIKNKTNYPEDSLKKVASFFFQEHIKELACDEVIQLLEPDNLPAKKMKEGLKSLQVQLEKWQKKLQVKKYKKDYGSLRKELAAKITDIKQALPDQCISKKHLDKISLIKQDRNLPRYWDSQIRKLSNMLSKEIGNTELIGKNSNEHLVNIAKCLQEIQLREDEVKNKLEDSSKPIFNHVFKDRLLQLLQRTPDLTVEWKAVKNNQDESILLQETLIIETNYEQEINILSEKQEQLRHSYRITTDSISKFNESYGLDNWLKSFHNNIDQWLTPFNNDATDKIDVDIIIKGLKDNIAKLETIAGTKLTELYKKREEIESQGRELASKVEKLNLYNSTAKLISRYEKKLPIKFIGKTFKIRELLDYVRSELNKAPKTSDIRENTNSIQQLIRLFSDWSRLEYEKEIDDKNITNAENIEQAESLLNEVTQICKTERGPDSKLLNLLAEIPEVELTDLVENMNFLLEKFHFPESFLPISLKNTSSTTKQAKWAFETNKKVKFSDLSTGQKTQLAICWTINLNMALSDTLDHRVIGFDDFTTSLDMNQMIPASILLRKMAYADNGDPAKRQVIVTSHHEDMTNRLLDFLLPPEGKTMRIIQFEDFSPETGPSFKTLKVDMGIEKELDNNNDVIKKGIEDLFSNT